MYCQSRVNALSFLRLIPPGPEVLNGVDILEFTMYR